MQLKTHNFGGCFRDNNRFSDITSGTQLVDQGLSLMFWDSWSLWSLVVAWSLKCNMWSLDFHELAIFFYCEKSISHQHTIFISAERPFHTLK